MSADVQEVKRARRMYLLKRRAALNEGDTALASVWLHKQQTQEGAELPSDFPFLAQLDAAGYFAVEDVDGASIAELTENVGLTQEQAAAVLAALALLPAPNP